MYTKHINLVYNVGCVLSHLVYHILFIIILLLVLFFAILYMFLYKQIGPSFSHTDFCILIVKMVFLPGTAQSNTTYLQHLDRRV